MQQKNWKKYADNSILYFFIKYFNREIALEFFIDVNFCILVRGEYFI